MVKPAAVTSNRPEHGTQASAWWEVLLSVWIWGATAGLTVCFTIIIVVVAAVSALIDPQRKSVHWIATLWGHSVFLVNPGWRITVEGRGHIVPNKPVILVANHQSLFDIIALFWLRRQFKWVAKESLFRIPFLGWSMRLAKYVILSRGRQKRIRHAYDLAKGWLAAGMPVFFFPEGTRSFTGELGSFQNGAFKLAFETGGSLVPIAVSGTHALLPRGQWVFRPHGHVRITILPPMDPSQYPPDGVDRFRDDIRQLIHDTLQQHTASSALQLPQES